MHRLAFFLRHEADSTVQWAQILWGDGRTLVEVANATYELVKAHMMTYQLP